MRVLWRQRVLAALFFAAALIHAPAAWPRGKTASIPKITPAEARLDTPEQAALLKQQVDALRPQKTGVTDIYMVGLAGWAGQDVFRSELTGAVASVAKALPVTGGNVQLINNAETLKELPLASRQNFATAIHAVAKVMDKQEDVLVLFITSHGNEDGIGLQMPRRIVSLSPAEVASVLNKEGIKNRVVIVSACFSGIFIKPLANANTIVLTAADSRSPSFGCTSDREWTYFGDALFNHSLRPGVDFRLAFDKARGLIAGWEKFERYKPSNPQAHFGAALVRKLAPLVEAMERVEPLPE